MPRRGNEWAVKVLGLEESVSVFREWKEAFGATPLKDCLMPIAERIRALARGRVKRGPGKTKDGRDRKHLADAIFASRGKEDLPSVIVGVDRKKEPHAHLVELGHGGPHPAPAYPYLRPSFDAVKRLAVAMMGQEITQRIIRKLTAKRKGLARP